MAMDGVLQYGRFHINLRNRVLYENQSEVDIEPLPLSMFQLFMEHIDQRFSRKVLEDKFELSPESISTAIFKIRTTLGVDQDLLEGKWKQGWRLKHWETKYDNLPDEIVHPTGTPQSACDPQGAKPTSAFPAVRHTDEVGQQLTTPEDFRTIQSGAKRFILSVDGIIINSVGELLFDTVEERVIRECRRSYERSLGDFAFSVVYGSQIRSKWRPITAAGTTASKEPGARAISLLPNGLYDFEPLDEDLRNGAILQNGDGREQVRKYIGCIPICLQSQFFAGLCKDLLVRESENFLGEDDSLFKKAKHYSDYHFGKNYYRHDLVEEIPALLGAPAITTLVGFLPTSPKKGLGGKRKDKYSESALVQFLSEVVLTHFTTMYEFEKISQRQETWRVPYALRAEVTRQLSQTQMQRQLRNIVVRHALRYALSKVSDAEEKAEIVSMLVAMRGIRPFVEIREMLGELVVLEADETKEARAIKLIQEIYSAGYENDNERRDSLSMIRNSVLRELGSEIQQGEYKSFLHRLFPTLEPLPPMS
jgi:hypothetical protein